MLLTQTPYELCISWSISILSLQIFMYHKTINKPDGQSNPYNINKINMYADNTIDLKMHRSQGISILNCNIAIYHVINKITKHYHLYNLFKIFIYPDKSI